MTLKQAIKENPYDLNQGNISAYCRYLRYNVDGFYTKTNDEVKTIFKDYIKECQKTEGGGSTWVNTDH